MIKETEVEIDDVIPNKFNPNFISSEELKELARSFSLEILEYEERGDFVRVKKLRELLRELEAD